MYAHVYLYIKKKSTRSIILTLWVVPWYFYSIASLFHKCLYDPLYDFTMSWWVMRESRGKKNYSKLDRTLSNSVRVFPDGKVYHGKFIRDSQEDRRKTRVWRHINWGGELQVAGIKKCFECCKRSRKIDFQKCQVRDWRVPIGLSNVEVTHGSLSEQNDGGRRQIKEK